MRRSAYILPMAAMAMDLLMKLEKEIPEMEFQSRRQNIMFDPTIIFSKDFLDFRFAEVKGARGVHSEVIVRIHSGIKRSDEAFGLIESFRDYAVKNGGRRKFVVLHSKDGGEELVFSPSPYIEAGEDLFKPIEFVPAMKHSGVAFKFRGEYGAYFYSLEGGFSFKKAAEALKSFIENVYAPSAFFHKKTASSVMLMLDELELREKRYADWAKEIVASKI